MFTTRLLFHLAEVYRHFLVIVISPLLFRASAKFKLSKCSRFDITNIKLLFFIKFVEPLRRNVISHSVPLLISFHSATVHSSSLRSCCSSYVIVMFKTFLQPASLPVRCSHRHDVLVQSSHHPRCIYFILESGFAPLFFFHQFPAPSLTDACHSISLAPSRSPHNHFRFILSQ